MTRALAPNDTRAILASVNQWLTQHGHDADGAVKSKMTDVRTILTTVVEDLDRDFAKEFPNAPKDR